MSKGTPDVEALAASFADALLAAGFESDRPLLKTALGGYEDWLSVPVPGTEWGESDCALVVMEPGFGGSYEIDLRRHVGEPDGGESAIGLVLRFFADQSPRLCSEQGAIAEGFDDPAAMWITRLRREAPIAAALAEDRTSRCRAAVRRAGRQGGPLT